jgi:hypothetical protein
MVLRFTQGYEKDNIQYTNNIRVNDGSPGGNFYQN